jgi:hypothetical protein
MPTGIGNPSLRFFFNRGWVTEWDVFGDWPSGHFEDNVHIGRSLDASDWYFYVIMKPNVWEWSSNMYSLDYMLQDAYATSVPLGITVPLTMDVLWQPNTSRPFPYLQMNRAGSEIYQYTQVLPPAPSSYWRLRP